jgi:hypothetical protein
VWWSPVSSFCSQTAPLLPPFWAATLPMPAPETGRSEALPEGAAHIDASKRQ